MNRARATEDRRNCFVEFSEFCGYNGKAPKTLMKLQYQNGFPFICRGHLNWFRAFNYIYPCLFLSLFVCLTNSNHFDKRNNCSVKCYLYDSKWYDSNERHFSHEIWCLYLLVEYHSDDSIWWISWNHFQNLASILPLTLDRTNEIGKMLKMKLNISISGQIHRAMFNVRWFIVQWWWWLMEKPESVILTIHRIENWWIKILN